MEVLWNPSIPFWGICPGKMKHWHEKKQNPCILIYSAALCSVAKIWKQLKCPLNKENTHTHKHTMGYYSTTKKELNLLHVCDKMNGPWIYFAQLSQAEKNKNCIISLISKILKKKNKFQVHRYEREQMGGCQSYGLGEGWLGWKGSKVQASSYKLSESWRCNVQNGDLN